MIHSKGRSGHYVTRNDQNETDTTSRDIKKSYDMRHTDTDV